MTLKESVDDVNTAVNHVSELSECLRDVDIKDEGDTHYSSIYRDMFQHLIKSPVVFKSQQREDPDLSDESKKAIGEEELNKSPDRFLQRFGPYMKVEHLQFFKPENKLISHKLSEDTDFHINVLRKRLDKKSCKIMKRNRRYGVIKKLEAEGKYFSESEMQKREPLLYHQLVGQYLTEREKLERTTALKDITPTFSSILLAQAEKDEIQALQDAQQQAEDECEEDTDSDDESMDVVPNPTKEDTRWGDDWSEQGDTRSKPVQVQHLDTAEKQLLFEEFKSHMHEKFLNGSDDFDYSSVDMDPQYDCLEVTTQDEEEKYFDSEEIDESENVCTDTGIDDY